MRRHLLTWLLAMAWVWPAAAQDFEIYVSDAGNFDNPPWQILRYEADGGNPQVFIDEMLAWPQDIVSSKTRAWCSYPT